MAAFTSIDQVKPGMRVRCVYSAGDRYDKEAIVVSVVEKVANTATGHEIYVKWDDGDPAFTRWNSPSSFEPFDPLSIAGDAEYIDKKIKQAIAHVIRQEKLCQVCGRNNDLGIRICWSCGNFPG